MSGVQNLGVTIHHMLGLPFRVGKVDTMPEGIILQALADNRDFLREHYFGKARYMDRRFAVVHTMGEGR